MSIQEPKIGYFGVCFVIMGTLVSYFIRVQTLRSKFIKWDGLIYSAGVIAAIYFSPQLSMYMPEGGFPREIAAAGWLTWMLVFGSFATWQDSTLLFQAIPSLAMFGLVGCYDTYPFVTFNFFAYLMCLATLFARAHSRQMLTQAASSGFFTRGLAPGSPIPSVDTTPGLANDLRRGPWRWVAGPEWALASALAVVLLSLLGAPIIRQSVSGIAGIVVLPPPPMKNPTTNSATSQPTLESDVRIGRGPNHGSARPVLEAHLDKFRYLREQSYLSYTGKGWRNIVSGFSSGQGQTSANDKAVLEMKKYHDFTFQIKLLQNLKLIPCPPEVAAPSFQAAESKNPGDDRLGQFNLRDGSVELTTESAVNGTVAGTSIEADSDVVPVNCVRADDVPSLYDRSNIPERIGKLAVALAQDSKNDYERITRISDEISREIVYNLDSDPTPADKDPIEYAMFESHQAYCDVYASAMVAMARSIGLPARYVQGYLPNEGNRLSNGAYVVSNLDYHAWAEVLFKDVGWVIVDPTIKANAVPGEGIGQAGRGRPWWKDNVPTIVGSAVAVVVIVPIIFLLRRFKPRARREVTPFTEAEKAYAGFLYKLERLTQVRRPIGKTGDEYIRLLTGKVGGCEMEVQALNDRFMPILYGPSEVDPTEVEDLKKQTSQVTKRLRDAIKKSKAK